MLCCVVFCGVVLCGVDLPTGEHQGGENLNKSSSGYMGSVKGWSRVNQCED